jgi:hypothetical protein
VRRVCVPRVVADGLLLLRCVLCTWRVRCGAVRCGAAQRISVPRPPRARQAAAVVPPRGYHTGAREAACQPPAGVTHAVHCCHQMICQRDRVWLTLSAADTAGAQDAARGIAFLHAHQPCIVHLDLKSPNLLIDKHWTCKIGSDLSVTGMGPRAARDGMACRVMTAASRCAQETLGSGARSRRATTSPRAAAAWALRSGRHPR